MQTLYEISGKLIGSVSANFVRGLYTQIDWQQRLSEITGARGVGKTTLMLQKAKELFTADPQSVLYISLDDPYFFSNSLLETADYFYKYGGLYMFIDEVHKYPAKHPGHDWSAELKNIYDLYPSLKVVYSGSSVIQLFKGNGDLSRRKNTYNLQGLSFREYMIFNKVFKTHILSLEDITNNHIEISRDIISGFKIWPHFNEYLKQGYYPFYKENPAQYFQRLKNIVNVIIETDIPAVSDINYMTIGKIKKLLAILASSVPYTPNLKNLSENLNITDLRTLHKYLNLLEKSELISLINTRSRGNKTLQKPDKVYLNNTNLMFALQQDIIETGTIREVFFCNQLMYAHHISYPKSGDFLVNNKYTFEIGGKNKTMKQISNTENAFLAIDDIEVGFANRIPIWLFGFLY